MAMISKVEAADTQGGQVQTTLEPVTDWYDAEVRRRYYSQCTGSTYILGLRACGMP